MVERNNVRRHGLPALRLVSALVAFIWSITALNAFSDYAFNAYGIGPRVAEGLLGVLLWPFLHGNLYHLLSNTTPLLLMGFLVALRGPWLFLQVTALVTILAGLGVWLMGRPAIHIGASGLVFGYFGFLVAISLVERSWTSLAIASFTLFYYGSMLIGILPTHSYVSWEGHLAGLIAGVFVARLLGSGRQKEYQ